jgi:hypothetical protein
MLLLTPGEKEETAGADRLMGRGILDAAPLSLFQGCGF